MSTPVKVNKMTDFIKKLAEMDKKDKAFSDQHAPQALDALARADALLERINNNNEVSIMKMNHEHPDFINVLNLIAHTVNCHDVVINRDSVTSVEIEHGVVVINAGNWQIKRFLTEDMISILKNGMLSVNQSGNKNGSNNQ